MYMQTLVAHGIFTLSRAVSTVLVLQCHHATVVSDVEMRHYGVDPDDN